MKYLLTLFGDESRWGERTPEQQTESMKAWDDFTNAAIDGGVYLGGEGLQPSATATTVRICRERRPHRQRRPVRRDQGAARRLLPARLQGPRRRARLGEADPDARRHRGGPAGHGLRGGRLRGALERGGGCAVGAPRGGRRPPVPARVGTGGRHPHPRARRLRPRRGGGAGRLRGRARALAAGRGADATRPPGSSARPATGRSTASGATGTTSASSGSSGRSCPVRRVTRGRTT